MLVSGSFVRGAVARRFSSYAGLLCGGMLSGWLLSCGSSDGSDSADGGTTDARVNGTGGRTGDAPDGGAGGGATDAAGSGGGGETGGAAGRGTGGGMSDAGDIDASDSVDASLPVHDGGDASNAARADAAGHDAATSDGAFGGDAAVDGGLPPHCANGQTDPGETDQDCGGLCAPCATCGACGDDADCAGERCSEGVCIPTLGSLERPDGGTRPVFIRADGAVLLAHYGPGARQSTYDPDVAQIADVGGGEAAGAGFAPDPCRASGHVPFTEFDPEGRAVTIECGTSYFDDVQAGATSSALFDSFADGDKGTYGTPGDPGWGIIAAIGSGEGRVNHASCGGAKSSVTGGVGYCSGTGGAFSNHIASYYTSSQSNSPYVGCGSAGCNGPDCDLRVWVWLEP